MGENEYRRTDERQVARRKAYSKKYFDANRDAVNAKRAEYRSRGAGQARTLIQGARHRAKKVGLPFDLYEHVDMVQARIERGHCELSGLPFTRQGDRGPFTPSLDRRVPADGYVLSNVRVICYGLNVALGNWGEDVLGLMVDAMREHI